MCINEFKMFDAHFHVIDPHFPLIANKGYTPEVFTCDDYLKCTSELSIIGGTVVSGSFQGFDQAFLFDALQKLGPTFVGVIQLPVTIADSEIIKLNYAGVRGVRFNFYSGKAETLENIEYFAWRIYELANWHIELYLDSKDLLELEQHLAVLPAVVIDHLGMTQTGFSALLHLVECGVKVKASGFGRVDLNVAKALKSIANVNPSALVFGTDLPGTRARRPFKIDDLKLILDTLGETLTRQVLYDNAVNWYKPHKIL
jgi:predicted TIM-barrel fold metal-dependent hydrolase